LHENGIPVLGVFSLNFESANPSVVRSIQQRLLLNNWLRALTCGKPLPVRADFHFDGVTDELDEMMCFDVEGNGEAARYLITQEGASLAATYGSEHIAPRLRINRYLDDAIGPERYARVAPCYLTCIVRKRPTYCISRVADADGKVVSYERLLLPFGRGDRVDQIVGSYKAISIDGGFKIDNLMGVDAATAPVRELSAVIDREISRRPPGVRIADDIVEAD
jgi:hypothetical protein